MSKRETPMTLRYWELVGGTLVQEYCIVRPRPGVSPRWDDAIIIRGGARVIAAPADIRLDGRDLIVVQTKTGRLGMYLLGQALFSRELIKAGFAPRSVLTVALCGRDDAALRPIAERFGIQVVVDNAPRWNGSLSTPGSPAPCRSASGPKAEG
jgi:hypothetical protein